MRKLVITSIVTAVLAAGSTLAISSYVSKAESPTGVAAANWKPISNDVGFVIHTDLSQATLMVLIDSKWVPMPVAATPPRYPEGALPAK